MEAINAKGHSHICMHLLPIDRRMRRGRSVAAAEERERAPRTMQGDTNQYWGGGRGGGGGVGAVHGGGESVVGIGAVELQAEQVGGEVGREPEGGAYGGAGEEGVRRRWWRWMAEP